MKVKKINEEVLYCGEKLVKVDREDITIFKKGAGINRRKRIRLCTHKNINDRQHEMLIVHKKGIYVRPHKHINKSESLHVIEGKAYLILFTGKGEIKQVIKIGDYRSKTMFYCRIPKGVYHNIIILSDWIVFHETTPGPFNRVDTVFASWSPEEDKKESKKYTSSLLKKIDKENA